MKNSTKAERKRARDLGFSVGELRLLELIEAMDERLRWAQILGYAAQYALKWKGLVTDQELETVIQAVSGSIDRDAGEKKRRELLAALRQRVAERDGEVREALDETS
ncbi:MAG: hypothetical protein JNM84_14790 [Planctomycetes bacterium]|nr:hypothetical protein [Planctomycetota bacterium]